MPQADVNIMPWPWYPGWDAHYIRIQYSHLRSLGINSFCSQHHIDDYKDNPAAADWYDRVYNLADEYGIKVYWWLQGDLLDLKNPITESHPVAKYFIERYGAFPACGGWFNQEEAATGGDTEWWQIREEYLKIKFQDPSDHPVFSVWVVALHDNWHDQYVRCVHPSDTETWCMIEDVCSIDCYPWYSGHDIDWLEYYVTRDNSNHHGDGPMDCPKKMIPCMQAWYQREISDPNRMPDDGIVQQYNIWKDTYGYSGFEAIGLYQAGSQIFGSNADNLKIQAQIKDLALLRGWILEVKLSGSLTFDKTLTWKQVTIAIGKLLYGSFDFSSSIVKKLFFPILSGTLSFKGPIGVTYTFLQSLTWTQLQGYLWKSISVKRLSVKVKNFLLSNLLSFSGALSTNAYLLLKKALTGVLSFSGALSHNFKLFLTGEISLSKSLKLLVKKTLFGSVFISGFIVASTICLAICIKTYTYLETLTWTEFQSYTWCKQILKIITLGGFLSPAGLLPKKIIPSLAGALSFIGSPFFKVKNIIVGVLNSSGVLANVFIQTLLSGDISFSGVLQRFIKIPLFGALSFLGLILTIPGNLKYLLRKLIQLIQIKGW